MATFIQDLRYAFRQMLKNPGFAGTAVITLTLAIGITTAVFSVLYAVLVRPLPYDHPEKIVYLQPYSPQGYTQPAAYPEYRQWHEDQKAFSAFAGFSRGSSNLEGPSGPTPLTSVSVTSDFFKVFGVNAMLGRTLLPGEDQDGKSDVLVLSYELWKQEFGGDKSAVGQTVKLDGKPFTVVGVMPAGFRYPVTARNAIYKPLVPIKELAESHGSHWLPIIGRLNDGVTVQQASADMDRVLNDEVQTYPEAKGRRMKVEDMAVHVVGDNAAPLKVLIFAVLAVLAIGCVNIAGLLLARGVKREREIALRSAIGANRLRIIRQMLTETFLLAAVGTAFGTLFAFVLLDAIRKLLVSALARGADVQVNQPVLVASLGLAVITTLLAGMAPALRLSGVAPTMALRSGGSAGTNRSQHRLRAAFIVVQMALALVLLVSSGLLLRVLSTLKNTELGFSPDNLLTTEISLSPAAYKGRDPLSDFYDPMLERVNAIPGVTAAGVIQVLPIQNWGWNGDVHVKGHPPTPPNQESLAEIRILSPGYFKAMGVRLIKGRMLDPKLDTPESKTTVVNEAFVKKFLAPDEDPIGVYLDNDRGRIVGVVSDVRQNIYHPPYAETDYLISQIAPKERELELKNLTLVIKTQVPPASIVTSLRRVFHDVDPGLPFRKPNSMMEVISDVLTFEQLENWLFGTFAVLAILMAIVGLYGLISHEVELSSRDIGVRMALGASRTLVLKNVYARVGMMLGLGVALGLITTFAVQKLLAAVVVIHASKDAPVISGLAAALVVAGLLAAFLPARRAASVEPMQALRYE